MKKYLLVAVLLFLSFQGGCDLFWEGTEDEAEHGHSVTATSEGGYLVVGSAPRGGDHVAKLHAFDQDDRLDWRRAYMAGSHHMLGRGVVELYPNDYVMVGYTYYGDGHGGYDPTFHAVLRIGEAGKVNWHQVFGGGDDGLYDILLTSNRTLLVSGVDGGQNPYGSQDDQGYWALLDLSGQRIWERTDSTFYPVSIVEAHGTGYMAIAHNGTRLARLNDDGTIAWQKQYDQTSRVGFTTSGNGDGRILRHGDGYLIVGAGKDEHYAPQMVVLKVAADGSVLWSRSLHEGTGVDAVQLDNGSVLIVGVEVTYDHESAPFIRYLPYATLIADNGEQAWERTYTSCSLQSFPKSAAKLANGDVIVAGGFSDEKGTSRVLRLRIEPNGDVVHADCE